MFDAQEEEEKKLQKLIDNAFDKKEARQLQQQLEEKRMDNIEYMQKVKE